MNRRNSMPILIFAAVLAAAAAVCGGMARVHGLVQVVLQALQVVRCLGQAVAPAELALAHDFREAVFERVHEHFLEWQCGFPPSGYRAIFA